MVSLKWLKILALTASMVAPCVPAVSHGQASDVPGGSPGSGSSPRITLAGGASLNSDDTPTSAGRLNRDGVPSTCAAVKTFPGTLFGPTPHAFDIVPYVNPGPAQCITLRLTHSCTNGNTNGAFLAAYSGALNPNDLSVGYLGDAGNSASGASMSLSLAAGQSINLMIGQVNDVNTSPASQCTYVLRDDQPTGAAVPTLNQWMMIMLGMLVATVAVLRSRRRIR